MSKFSLPKDDDPKVDQEALREFASGAKNHRTKQEPPSWEKHDPEDIPRHNVSVRLNDYQLEMLRYLAKQADTSQQKILKKILIPAIEVQVEDQKIT
ncbi:MAG: hypothetical protein GY703_11180 [Gammaproteobacteria bacterium]|nr:hypothetical protein [Gammaproteobacteria bacterium]